MDVSGSWIPFTDPLFEREPRIRFPSVPLSQTSLVSMLNSVEPQSNISVTEDVTGSVPTIDEPHSIIPTDQSNASPSTLDSS